MRRIALSGLAVALALGSASLLAAQQPQQPQAGQGQQQRWQRQGGRGEGALLRGITLSAQQKDQVKQIRERYRPQFQQIQQSLRQARQQSGAQAQGRAGFDRNSPQFQQLRSLREQELRDVRAVLTADQQRTFDQNVAQLKQRMDGMRQGMQGRQGGWQGQGMRQGRGGEGALLRGVNPTAQQQEQIKQIREKYQAQFRQIHESLRPAGQQGGAQGQARPRFDRNSPQFQQLRALREQELKEVRAILTPDQQKTFDQNVAQQRQRMEQRMQQRQRGQRQGA